MTLPSERIQVDFLKPRSRHAALAGLDVHAREEGGSGITTHAVHMVADSYRIGVLNPHLARIPDLLSDGLAVLLGQLDDAAARIIPRRTE